MLKKRTGKNRILPKKTNCGCQANGVVKQLGIEHGMNCYSILKFNLFKVNDFFNIVNNPQGGQAFTDISSGTLSFNDRIHFHQNSPKTSSKYCCNTRSLEIKSEWTRLTVFRPVKNWFMISVRISSYGGCTREAWRARKMRNKARLHRWFLRRFKRRFLRRFLWRFWIARVN